MLLKTIPHEILGVAVNCDFLFWMELGTYIDSEKLTIEEKIEVVNKRVFKCCPADGVEAIAWYKAIIDFYLCGAEDRGLTPPKERLLDWKADSDAIWGDFYRAYGGMDLDKIPPYNKKQGLHWWQFKALFDALPPDSNIKNKISIRGEDINGIKDAEYRRAKEEQKRAVSLDPPDDFMEW